MDEYKNVLEKAKQFIDERMPATSAQKRAAFANSVAYLVTGLSGGYGGPSVREHAASHKYGLGGRLTYDEAVAWLSDPKDVIFGPLTDVHRGCWAHEYCFDDDPDDIRNLESLN